MASFRIQEHTCAHFVAQLAALGEESVLSSKHVVEAAAHPWIL
jgi:hypothetical protein